MNQILITKINKRFDTCKQYLRQCRKCNSIFKSKTKYSKLCYKCYEKYKNIKRNNFIKMVKGRYEWNIVIL